MTDVLASAAPSAPVAAGASAPIGYVLKVFPRVSETFVINEIRALEALGETVRVFSLHHPPERVSHGILRELRAPVVYIDDTLPPDGEVGRGRRRLERLLMVPEPMRDAVLPRKYVRLAMALAVQLRASGVSHVHAHFATRAGHVGALAARMAECSFSFTAHAKDIYHRDVDPALLRWKISEAAFVATVTELNRQYLAGLVADLAGASETIVRVYNGVDLERFRAEAAPSAIPLLLGVGRLVEKKGFRVLVEACRQLRQRGAVFRCEIIGEGPERSALAAQIEAAGLGETVTLLGTMSTEDVALALGRASIAVLPCIVAGDGNVDALPTVLLEAMAAARPVVSTRISGIPEIVVDGETGHLVPPQDPGALAQAIGTLLDDPRRARAMGAAGRQRAAEQFDLHRNARRLSQHLRAARVRTGV